ncbi:MAG: hypothetical protein ISQ56_05520 [Pseudomonadales bacterium]|nr:hypothetical protein [Pseudomonadales bacterium]
MNPRQKNPHYSLRSIFFGLALFGLLTSSSFAEVVSIDVASRETIAEADVSFSYESIVGVVHFTLDPAAPGNQAVVDLAHAPINAEGLVEYSADFKLLVPSANIASDFLYYNVNNRGGSRVPPEVGLDHPLAELGYTYLVTGWINEISSGPNRQRLHAPIVTRAGAPIKGDVRYEVTVSAPSFSENIAGSGHLAYTPTREGLATATLSKRLYQDNTREYLSREDFELQVTPQGDSNQPLVELILAAGFEPGVIYELIYEAQDPVLAGSGMTAIRDLVSLMRFGGESAAQLTQLGLPNINHTAAWGISQSGRLLRQFVYQGFNEDLEGRRVFDGVIPVIAGAGYGMFNHRFAMPTRFNGQHSNHLYPNDYFPFTYGESTDPFSGRSDGVLKRAIASGTDPKIMHIQTSNEYWVRGGSLPHTNPEGTEDAELPSSVRFYTLGGSQHGSGSGLPRPASSGQLPPNPNRWSPLSDSILVAMAKWIAEGKEPPVSRYPRIADGSLVASHTDRGINHAAWNPLEGVNHPSAIYRPAAADYGSRWERVGIIDSHPQVAIGYYNPLVPAVNPDNNDSADTTVLSPLTQAPVATFVPWNLRAEATGAPLSLARLAGGYIPLPASPNMAAQTRDARHSLTELYQGFDDYLAQFEAATDKLIAEGYLLAGFKEEYMAIAAQYADLFERR